MRKILIIEDDDLIAELERDYLEAENFQVEICPDGSEAMKKTFSDYDLVLLDVMLPKVNGFEVCQNIRKVSNVPIIFVTAKLEDVDKIKGLGLDADDYITKPFNPSELIARVMCHIKIHERLLNEVSDSKKNVRNNYDAVIDGNGIKIDGPSRLVYIEGKEIQLKNKEFDLLLFLASNPGIVFSKESLLEKVWGMGSDTDSATVMVHINRLREKIEKNPSEPKYIITVWGSGYKFVK